MPGKDVTLVAHGLMVAESIRAADILESEGISARVLDLHTIKPLDSDALAKAATETGALVVAEEHLVDSGLGARVAQALSLTRPAPIEYVGLTGFAESGTPEAVVEKYGLTAASVAAAARRVLARK